MPVTSARAPDGTQIIHTHDLANISLALDNTTDPWFLGDGRASIVRGRDVTRPGVLASDRGRKPLGISTGLTGITDAHGVEFVSRAGTRFTGIHVDKSGTEERFLIVTGTPAAITKLDAPVAWPADCVGALLVIGEDQRYDVSLYDHDNDPPKSQSSIITSITGANNETLNLESITETGGDTPDWKDITFKLHILYPVSHDKRGIWITDGRKFYLIHAGVLTQYIDLVSDDYLGERWDVARVHQNTIMFVSDKYPPIVVRIDATSTVAGVDDSNYAGLIPPIKPLDVESKKSTGSQNRSWLLGQSVTTDNIEMVAGKHRAVVRAVNLDDNLYSSFVTAWSEGDASSDFLTLVADAELSVYTTEYQIKDPPPIHSRMTHIEIWLSKVDSTIYHLVNRIEIADWPNEFTEQVSSTFVTGEAPSRVAGRTTAIAVDDQITLSCLPVLESSEVGTNGLPPLCRKIESLAGTTFCGGRAASDAKPGVVVYGKDLWSNQLQIRAGSNTVEEPGLFLTYTYMSGDEFVLTDGGPGEADLGATAVLSKIDNDTISVSSISQTSAPTTGYIRRPYTVNYPEIRDDEDLWYSRADLYAPESFPTRSIRLSSIGDDFRDMVVVGKYLAVIMRSGVHLIYKNDTGRVIKRTIAHYGEGTPWEYSVISYGRVVLWASADGPKMMSVSEEASVTGNLANIELLGGSAVRQWFRDAFDDGKVIDAGLDEINSSVRWRRSDPNDGASYQVLQFNYRTNLWTELLDDNGIAYASSSYAESTAKNGLALYSVATTGDPFEVNYQGLTHPYDSDTVQDTILETDLSEGGGVNTLFRALAFNAKMVGDMIRLDKADGTTHVRVIVAASANSVQFSKVTGLAAGDVFKIGANQFQIKFAHLAGRLRQSVKTLQGILLYIRPGKRNIGSFHWPATPVAQVTAKIYEEFSATAVSQPSAYDEAVAIFDEGNSGKTSDDRALGLDGQGTAIELELSCSETRADFSIEKVEAIVIEEGDFAADADTGS